MIGRCKICDAFGRLNKFRICIDCWQNQEVRREAMNTGEDDDIPASKVPYPDAPTHAYPGSSEKLLVMEDRAARKVGLFHPFDSSFADDNRPDQWQQMQQEEREKVLIESNRRQFFSMFFS